MARLFDPIKLGSLELPNRIIIAPMCQYAAKNGCMTDWHFTHITSLAMSSAGLFIVEATGVSPEGRISPACTGLFDDASEAAMARVVKAARELANMPIAIQLGHAGRKASSKAPADGGAQIPSTDPDGWVSVAPSALAQGEGEEAPVALDGDGLAKVKADFVAASLRAARLGFDGIELHMAHGYLLHQFLSPLSNQRDDEYGGSLENRLRFPVEVLTAVRAALPDGYPLWVRLSAVDWVEGGLTTEDSVEISKALEAAGADALHISSGGLSGLQQIPVGPGYQVHLAEAVKAAVTIPVIAVGLITDPKQAEAILADGQADAIAMARAFLWDPRWPWRAAVTLGAKVQAPKQYWRSVPAGTEPPFADITYGQRAGQNKPA